MYMMCYKTKKKMNEKGFTLVELLAVIVILAIIMIIAIPTILDSLDNAKRKSFETYTNRILALADQETMKREMDGNSFDEQCFVYNITKDFELNNTGDYKGYVLLQVSADSKKYYVTMWSNDYMLISYNITENIDYSGKKKSIQEALERYDSSREDELTIQSLCNYACSSCVYDNNGESENINGDITKIKGATFLKTGKQVSKIFSTVATDRANIIKFKRADTLDESKNPTIISLDEGISKDNPVYIWFDNGTMFFWTDATAIFLNSYSNGLLSYLSNVTDLSDFINSTNANLVEDASYIFEKCGIEELDLSNWTFEKTKNMSFMFSNCSKLKHINLTNFKTSNVIEMLYMFSECSSLEELNISHFDTSNVTTMMNLFSNCKSLKNLDVSNWNVSNVKDMRSTFANCSGLESLDVSRWNVSKIESMAHMFAFCSSLKRLDLSNWDVSNVKNMSYMFNYCSSLKELDVTKWNVGNVENLSVMFAFAFEGLDKMDLSSWKAYNVKSIDNMFCGARIKHLDLTGIHINNVTGLGDIFSFSGLHTIDISTWDNSNVNSYYRMFFDSKGLEHVYIGPNWTTENYASAKHTAQMFRNNNKLHNWDGTCNYTHANAGSDGYFEYK